MAKKVSEILTAAQQAELAALVYNVNSSGKKGRAALRRAIKEAAEDNPQYAPHLKQYLEQMKDVDDTPPVKDEDKPLTRSQLDAIMAEQEGQRRAAAAQQAQATARQGLLDSGRYTAESIKGLDTFIEKNGYGALPIESAAVLYAHENPPTSRPTIGNGDQMWELPRGKELLKDPKKTARERAYAVIDDMRRRA